MTPPQAQLLLDFPRENTRHVRARKEAFLMRIKFINLAAQNQEIAQRIEHELEQVHSHTSYVGGEQVEKFEQEFANYLGVKRVVGVANGTDALRLALLALGVGTGDEVITVPMTFIATAASIVQTGARPVLVD